jgi:hypothetical protein
VAHILYRNGPAGSTPLRSGEPEKSVSTTKGERGAAKARAVHTIVPTNVYTVPAAAEALSAKANTLPREIRLRRLRASKRGGRYYILGEWLIEWLRAGEIRKNAQKAERASQVKPDDATAAH